MTVNTAKKRCNVLTVELRQDYRHTVIIFNNNNNNNNNRISHLSASAGKYSLILRYVMNRIRLGGLIYNLKSFLQLNMFQELQICICMYVFGCRLSLFRLCGSDFGITPVDDITNGIT